MEKEGRKEEKWEESWNRAADWLKPALRNDIDLSSLI